VVRLGRDPWFIWITCLADSVVTLGRVELRKLIVSPPFNVVIIGKVEVVILRGPLIGVRLIEVALGRNVLVMLMLP